MTPWFPTGRLLTGGAYPDPVPEERAGAIRGGLPEGRTMFVFFGKTTEGDAVDDALKLS